MSHSVKGSTADDCGPPEVSTAVLQAQLDAGVIVTLPPGRHTMDAPLYLRETGAGLRGASWWEGGGTCLVAGFSGDPVIDVTTQCSIENLEIDCAGMASSAIRVAAGYNSEFHRVYVHHATASGIFVTATGNNNFLRFTSCASRWNGVDGLTVVEAIDNNALEIIGAEFCNNAVNGITYSGNALKTFGGQFVGNGGYGIQLGEVADAGPTLNCTLHAPYLEYNGTGGLLYANATRNLVIAQQGPDGIDRVNGDRENVALEIETSTSGRLRVVTGAGDVIAFEGTGIFSENNVGAHADLWLTAKGQGLVKTRTDFSVNLVGGGIVLYSPNGTAYRVTVSDAGALVVT